MSRTVIHTKSFNERLEQEAQRLKEQAKKLKSGPKRDALVKKASQLETASHINEWLSSSGLLAPT